MRMSPSCSSDRLPLALVPLIAARAEPARRRRRRRLDRVGPATIDFGVRGTSADGDAARYERYRDLGDGLFLETRAAGPGTERLAPRLRRRSRRPPRSALHRVDRAGPAS